MFRCANSNKIDENYLSAPLEQQRNRFALMLHFQHWLSNFYKRGMQHILIDSVFDSFVVDVFRLQKCVWKKRFRAYVSPQLRLQTCGRQRPLADALLVGLLRFRTRLQRHTLMCSFAILSLVVSKKLSLKLPPVKTVTEEKLLKLLICNENYEYFIVTFSPVSPYLFTQLVT